MQGGGQPKYVLLMQRCLCLGLLPLKLLLLEVAPLELPSLELPLLELLLLGLLLLGLPPLKLLLLEMLLLEVLLLGFCSRNPMLDVMMQHCLRLGQVFPGHGGWSLASLASQPGPAPSQRVKTGDAAT